MKKQMRDERALRARKRWFHFFRAVTIFVLLMTGLGIGFIGGLFASVAKVLPPGEELKDIRPPSPTRILASDGSLLAKIYYIENRELVPINQMKYMPTATIAIEDVRFYDHPGVDPRGIIRAFVKNILAGNTKEGASTITQQLARNLYLTREKKITRKLAEVIISLQLERRYSKQEILETYLNQVYYGANRNSVQSWGVQMAAKNYFNKDVSKLTLAESALLAGLPKNPHGYDPYRNIEAARKRRNLVLANMLAYRFINRAQYEAAKAEPIKLAPEKKQQKMADYHAPYFVRHILTNELPKLFGQDTGDLVYHYGIDVYTSLDPRMQKQAEDVVADAVQANKSRRIDDGALISIDPKTGFIKAMVGGTNFTRDQYNIVTQGHRQPGSAFKPFVYTAALLHGYTPKTIVRDSPGRFRSGAGGIWSPKNSDGRFYGAIPLQRALWLSRNAAAANVANDVGIQSIIDVAHRMGIKYKLESYLTTALGASVVVPMEICSAYGTLANGGVHNPAVGIVRVTTQSSTPNVDNILYEYRPQPKRAIPTEIADTMKMVMRGVIERGTARSVMAGRLPFKASGKTGTTNAFRDAWFIGYTDDLVTAVWVGNRHNQSMNRTFGGTVPAPIWRDYMLVAQPIMATEHLKAKSALASVNSLPEPKDLDRKPTPYIVKIEGKSNHRDRQRDIADPITTEPEANARDRYVVIICTETHQRATAWCPSTMAVTYVRGRSPYPPSRSCRVHTGPEDIPDANTDGGQAPTARRTQDTANQHGTIVMSVCADTGKIATSRCPRVLRKRFAPEDAPTETCPLHGE